MWRYRETLNGITHRTPLPRSPPAAWAVVFVWEEMEPPKHHLPISESAVVAFAATAFIWCWGRLGALILGGYSGMLRPSEFMLLSHKGLILPADTDYETAFARMVVGNPRRFGLLGPHKERGSTTLMWSPEFLHALFFELPPLHACGRRRPTSSGMASSCFVSSWVCTRRAPSPGVLTLRRAST